MCSPELPPPKKKRVTSPAKKATVKKKKVVSTPTKATVKKKLKPPVTNPDASKKQTAKSKAVKTKPHSKPASIAPTTNKVKELRASQTNTASGGVHLTFHDSSSSSSESSSESSDDDTSNKVVTKSTNSSVPQKANKTIKQTTRTPGNVTRPVSARGKPRGRGGKIQHSRRSLPSNLVIGGPSDVHSTKSTVYNKPESRNETENVSTDLITKPNTQSTSVPSHLQRTTGEATTGWDVMPKELNDALSRVSKDYSTLPALDGAPRIGDCLAFKVHLYYNMYRINHTSSEDMHQYILCGCGFP